MWLGVKVQVKVKVTLVQALRLCTGRTACRGSRGITLPFHDHSTRRRWGVSVTPRPLFTPRKDPLYRRLGGPQGRSGRVQKISPPPGFDPRTVQPVASGYTDWATWPTCLGAPLVIFSVCGPWTGPKLVRPFAITMLDTHILLHSTNQEYLPKLMAVQMEEDCRVKKILDVLNVTNTRFTQYEIWSYCSMGVYVKTGMWPFNLIDKPPALIFSCL